MSNDTSRNLTWTLPKFYVLLFGAVVGLLGWACSELYGHQLAVGREAKIGAGANSKAIGEIKNDITAINGTQTEILHRLDALVGDRCYGHTCEEMQEDIKDHEFRIRALEKRR